MENANNIAKNLQVYLLENILNNIPKNAKLEKKKINGTIIYESPEVKAEKYNISRCFYFDKYDEIVNDFSRILETKLGHCNLSAFYKNMETAKIKDKIEDLADLIIFKFRRINGGYDSYENKILLCKLEQFKNTLRHELLHLASTKKKGSINFCGFWVKNLKVIGFYLNEGYTEYLNCKYFSSGLPEVYIKEVEIARRIERIVGSTKMEQLYFDANLLGLIEYLAEYSSKEEVINLIKKIDFHRELSQKKWNKWNNRGKVDLKLTYQ